MVNIKYSLLEMIKKPFITLLIVIQLAFCMILVYNVTKNNILFNHKNTDVYTSINDKIVYNMNYSMGLDSDFNNEGLKKLENYIYSINSYDKVFISKYMPSIKSFKGVDEFKDYLVTDENQLNSDINYTGINALTVSKNYFDVFGYSLLSGNLNEFFSYFDEKNPSQDIIPVVLGSSYKKYFSIGDIIEGNYENYKVVAFLSPNQYGTAVGNSYFPGYMKNLNNFLIIPEINNKDIANTTLVFSKDTNNEIIKNDLAAIKDKSKEFNFPISFKDFEEEIDIYNDNISFNINIDKLMLTIISVFIIIGITTIFLTKISRNEREYSIHLLTGASLFDIVLRTFYEILITMGISLIMASGLISILNNTNFIQNREFLTTYTNATFDIKSFLITILVFLIISVVLSIIPAIKILRYNIAYLTKGEE